MEKQLVGKSIRITGIVQGVGFRPFIYNLAHKHRLFGWVRNTSAGVDIEITGERSAVDAFINSLYHDAPILAQIDNIALQDIKPPQYKDFQILQSEVVNDAFQPISADISICNDCLQELFNPNDRRYHYPFINCTNCGPRFTIIKDIPYDRPNTTMQHFQMCPDCIKEYNNPTDRRYHAQPIACPSCGPHIWLEYSNHRKFNLSERILDTSIDGSDEKIIAEAQNLLISGKIIAIKGIGGFHLACDATNSYAIARLREAKLRVDKPFALMAADILTIESYCKVSESERQMLTSRERPIIILQRREDCKLSFEIAPNQKTIGIMLPYSPLHYLLFNPNTGSSQKSLSTKNDAPKILVMTSGNLSEEPIAFENEDAKKRLSNIVDSFLMHNRSIHIRCDDSVVRSYEEINQAKDLQLSNSINLTNFYRRSRGYAPNPLYLPWKLSPILATGTELKNTFCLTRDHYALISHHIGDLENYETLRAFEDSIEYYERIFRIKPSAVVYDLHPNYLATRYALERSCRDNIPAYGIQHHHAHIAACMAENRVSGDKPIIGAAFDGTGYGEDNNIWGGEFLIADYQKYYRFLHLEYLPLPGGDIATHKPARIALAYLWHAGIPWDDFFPSVNSFSIEERAAIRSQLVNGVNVPLTSSMGRLFDAVAAIIGVRQVINYEAQAAIELEAIIDPEENGSYEWENSSSNMINNKINRNNQTIIIKPLIQQIVEDLSNSISKNRISAKFHNSIANLVVNSCLRAKAEFGVDQIALSGGVWQNMSLLKKTYPMLKKHGFSILVHHKIPANDGGVSLGQAIIGQHITSTDSNSFK